MDLQDFLHSFSQIKSVKFRDILLICIHFTELLPSLSASKQPEPVNIDADVS